MANPNGRKGASFESLEAKYFKEAWPDSAAEFIDRQVRKGAKDIGDLANVRLGGRKIAVELKNAAGFKLGTWYKEAVEEAGHLGALVGIVVHKRVGKGQPGDQWVTMTVDDLITIIHAARSES